jgi:hypothetical protein
MENNSENKFYSDYWNKIYSDPQAIIDVENMGKEDFKKYETIFLNKINSFIKIIDGSLEVDFSYSKSKYENDDNVILLPIEQFKNKTQDGKLLDITIGALLIIAILKKDREVFCILKEKMNVFFDEDANSYLRMASLLYLHVIFNKNRNILLDSYPGLNIYINKYIDYSQDTPYSKLVSLFSKDADSTGPFKFFAILKELELDKNNSMYLNKFETMKDKIISQLLNLELNDLGDACFQLASHFKNKDTQILTTGTPISRLFYSKQNISIGGNVPIETTGKDDSEFKAGKKNDKYAPKIVIGEVKDNFVKLYDFDTLDVAPITEAIIESLEILNFDVNSWNEYSLKSGEVDEASLERLYLKDDNIFYQVEDEKTMNIRLTLLLDESYSMQANIPGYIADNAIKKYYNSDEDMNVCITRSGVVRKLSVAFCEALKEIKNVKLNIYGHAGPDPVCTIYPYVTDDTPPDDYNKVSFLCQSKLHNLDGFALEYVGGELTKTTSNYKKDILFMFTDGEPSVSDYSGDTAINHLIEVIQNYEAHGISIYGIGIGDDAFSMKQGEEVFGKNKYILLENFSLEIVSQKISAFLGNMATEL